MAHRNPGVAVWLSVAVVAVALVTPAMAQKTNRIPSIPNTHKDDPLAYLWRHALRQQNGPSSNPRRDDEPAPQSFVTPNHVEVTNWVPQDSPHPLYLPEYADLLREILLDSMLLEKVNPYDHRISEPNGLQVINLNGKTVTFTRDSSGGLEVNGVAVSQIENYTDGTNSYILEGSIFGHDDWVREAWEALTKTGSRFGSFGGPPPHGPPPEHL